MKTDDRDWRRLDLGDQIRCLETEGYVVFPELLRDRLPAQGISCVATLLTVTMNATIRTASKAMCRRVLPDV